MFAHEGFGLGVQGSGVQGLEPSGSSVRAEGLGFRD